MVYAPGIQGENRPPVSFDRSGRGSLLCPGVNIVMRIVEL